MPDQETPTFPPHDDPDFDYSPGSNPSGTRRGATNPFEQPAAYRGQGDPLRVGQQAAGDYSRPAPAPHPAAAQAPAPPVQQQTPTPPTPPAPPPTPAPGE